MKSWFFIGHREASSEILEELTEVVKHYIAEHGVKEFFVENYGGFDHMAAKAVMRAKQQYPEITLSMLIPFHPAERSVELPKGFDGTFFPPGMEKVPRKLAIVRANRYMIEHVDYLIACVWHPASNARNLVEYAQKKGVPLTNIATDRICTHENEAAGFYMGRDHTEKHLTNTIPRDTMYYKRGGILWTFS